TLFRSQPPGSREVRTGVFVVGKRPPMKCWIVVFLVAWEASKSKLDDVPAPPATPTASYKADIENLCDVMTRSGAADHDYNDRTYLIATWLSGHLTTSEARKFLATIQPLSGEPKAKALDAE